MQHKPSLIKQGNLLVYMVASACSLEILLSVYNDLIVMLTVKVAQHYTTPSTFL